jgi:hypothetical protein
MIPPAASPTPASNVFVLHHVPEDQTGASKEAMIQTSLMIHHLKEVYEGSKLAYDASTALQANVRVSAIVSWFPVKLLLVHLDSVHPLGVFF